LVFLLQGLRVNARNLIATVGDVKQIVLGVERDTPALLDAFPHLEGTFLFERLGIKQPNGLLSPCELDQCISVELGDALAKVFLVIVFNKNRLNLLSNIVNFQRLSPRLLVKARRLNEHGPVRIPEQSLDEGWVLAFVHIQHGIRLVSERLLNIGRLDVVIVVECICSAGQQRQSCR